jgi:GNAT superfamily N-acetyltransferase
MRLPLNVPLTMIRESLDNLPTHRLPPDFSVRWYLPGDEAHWLQIHLEADHLNPITPDLFTKQFGSNGDLLKQRQCYLMGAKNEPIGTATAWFNDDFEGGGWGRVHWLAILPQYHGRGLANPLLRAVCQRLRELGHERAYLTTSALRLPAIRLYRSFGFMPFIRNQDEAAAWSQLGLAG